MLARLKRSTCIALAVSGLLALTYSSHKAEANSNQTASRPYGVLANAADAAAAASKAAEAASNAANAAAKAAAAALEAIRTIQPQSQMYAPPLANRDLTPSPSSTLLKTPPYSTYPVQAADNSPAGENGSKKFLAPEQQSLVGLTGKFEVPVYINLDNEMNKNFANGFAYDSEPVGKLSDTNLSESISAGRSFSRDTLIAGARLDQAKAQTGQALGTLLPSVYVRANRGQETSTPSVSLNPATGLAKSSDTHVRTDAIMVVRQPLVDLASFFDWRRRGVVEKARSETRRATDGDAYVSTVNAYLSLVSSRVQADMTRDFEAQLNELLVYVEKRASAGAASVSDMSRVRARSLAALSSRMEQESAHAAAGVEFVRLTNHAPKMVRLPELSDVGISHLPENLDYAVTLALLHNPEMKSLNHEIKAAKIDMTAAKSRFLPRLDLEYTDNYSKHASGDPNPNGQRDQRLMMVMNWNLFSGGTDYQYHQERSARSVELRYRMDDQRRRIIQSLSANYATLTSTKERLQVGYSELKSISTAAEAMSKRMLSGNQSLLDLLDVYDRYYQARVRLVNLHSLEMNTIAQIVRLVYGVPSDEAAKPVKPAETAAPKQLDIIIPEQQTASPNSK